MANPFEGGVSFDFEGKKYTLVLDFNAMAEYEGLAKENAMDVLRAHDDGTITATQLRALFWSMLLEHHPEVTIREAGRMVISASEKLGEALLLASSETDPSGNAKRRTKPPRR